jgi:hypothetical protein
MLSKALDLQNVVKQNRQAVMWLKIVTWDNLKQVRQFILDNFETLDETQH